MKKIFIFLVLFSVSLYAKEAASTSKVAKKNNNSETVKKGNVNWSRAVEETEFSKKVHSIMSGYYIGGGFGPILNDIRTNRWFDVHGQRSNILLENNSAFHLFIGHNVTKWFAMEVAYSRGFQYKETSVNYPNFPAFNKEISTEDSHIYSNFYLNAVFKRTFTKRNEVFLKLGLGYNMFSNKRTEETRTLEGELTDPNVTVTINHDNISLEDFGTHIALGYQYKFTKHKVLGFSYNLYGTFGKDSYELNGSKIDTTGKLRVNYSTLMIEWTYHF